MAIEDHLGVDPKEFSAARNALVAELRRKGKSAEATAARRLRKPTIPVWVVNQVARQRPAEVKAFVSAADDLRRGAPVRPGALQRAAGKHQAALRNLLRRAEEVLRTAGYTPSPGVMLRASNTFLGAAADPRARADLVHGRLSEELQPPGLEALVASSGARNDADADDREPRRGPAAAKRRHAASTKARSTKQEARADERAARAQERERRRAARAEERAIRRAAASTEHAAKRAARAARTRITNAELVETRLRGRAEKLERAAEALRSRLRAAERDAAAARATHERAAEDLRRAREATGRQLG